MGLNHFLAALFENGRVPVDDPDAPLESDDVEELLAAFDCRAREQLAFAAPEFSHDAARWAAMLMYRACQLLVFRKLDAQAVKQLLGMPCPTRLSPGTIYSADLVLQVLPELTTMARAVAEQDVLVAELRRLGYLWPLSSVGMPQITANQFDPQALELLRPTAVCGSYTSTASSPGAIERVWRIPAFSTACDRRSECTTSYGRKPWTNDDNARRPIGPLYRLLTAIYPLRCALP